MFFFSPQTQHFHRRKGLQHQQTQTCENTSVNTRQHHRRRSYSCLLMICTLWKLANATFWNIVTSLKWWLQTWINTVMALLPSGRAAETMPFLWIFLCSLLAPQLLKITFFMSKHLCHTLLFITEQSRGSSTLCICREGGINSECERGHFMKRLHFSFTMVNSRPHLQLIFLPSDASIQAVLDGLLWRCEGKPAPALKSSRLKPFQYS